jgi:hypothetical protein
MYIYLYVQLQQAQLTKECHFFFKKKMALIYNPDQSKFNWLED